MINHEFFMTDGRVFTVEVPPETAKNHAIFYTYRVEHVPASARWPEAFFVKVQRSPSDEKFVYLGKLDTFTGQVERTQASAFPAHSFRLKLLNRVLARLWTGDMESITRHGYKVYEGTWKPVVKKVKRRSRKKVQSNGRPTPEPETFFVSEWQGSLQGLTAHYNNENELTHWTGHLDGKPIIVFND